MVLVAYYITYMNEMAAIQSMIDRMGLKPPNGCMEEDTRNAGIRFWEYIVHAITVSKAIPTPCEEYFRVMYMSPVESI